MQWMKMMAVVGFATLLSAPTCVSSLKCPDAYSFLGGIGAPTPVVIGEIVVCGDTAYCAVENVVTNGQPLVVKRTLDTVSGREDGYLTQRACWVRDGFLTCDPEWYGAECQHRWPEGFRGARPY